MSEYQTVFASLKDYTKGSLTIINDNPKYYVFSNVFEVAAKSKPYEKVAVAVNVEYVIEAVRAEGISTWFAAAHDEIVVVMDGEVRIDFIKLDAPNSVVPAGHQGAVAVKGTPAGRDMGHVICKRGHQALLPVGSAYRFTALKTGAMIMQTIMGDLTVQKWNEICYQ
jgi:hypothetical protein